MSKKPQRKRRAAVHRPQPARMQNAQPGIQNPQHPASGTQLPLNSEVQEPQTVAACLIVKDEEANIGRCMASLQGKVDEIIVVDTGSRDRTAEVAEQAGARVVAFEWCDDFAAARNFSVEHATSDWVVWVDADEELMEETPGALRNLCQNQQVRRGYLLDCRNLSNEQGDVGTIIRQWRLFRNHAGLHFEGRIHEHLIPLDGSKQIELAEQNQVWIRHWGYIPKPDVMQRKRERNFALLKRALEEQPDDAFFHYNLGKQYTAERQYEPGLAALERAIELWFEQEGQVPFAYTGNMFALAINAAVELGQNDKALAIEASIPPAFRGSDVMFQAGVAYMRLKRYDEAIARLNLAWQQPTGGHSIESDPSLSTWRPLGALANLYMDIGNPTEAYACAQRAYQFEPKRPNVLYALAYISAHLGQLDEALRWARQLLDGDIDEGFKPQARRIILNIGRGTDQPALISEATSGPVQGLGPEEAEALRTEADAAQSNVIPSEAKNLPRPPGATASGQDPSSATPPQNDNRKLNLRSAKRRKGARKGPLLSIVVPAFRAAMLRRCLESTRSVTVDCEIVVVDDASPEDLKSVVDNVAATDKRVRVVRNESNLGIPKNFNKCIEQARGEYVCILGDDDQFLPGNFEKKLAILENNPDIGYVYSRWNGLDKNGQVVFGGAALHTKQSYIGGRREFHDLLHGNYINLVSLVFRRELFERYGGFDEAIPTLCDWDMCLRWAHETKTAFVAEPLANVLVHAESDTQRRGITDQQFAKDKLAVWRKWLIERTPPLIIDEETWLRLAQFYNADLAHWFGADSATIEHYRQQFNGLQQEYGQRVGERWNVILSQAKNLPGSAAAVDSSSPAAPQNDMRQRLPKLSILVPAYNRPDMLGQCLDSLHGVTVDCEIVVVDDASPTDLRPHVEPYIERDSRIRLFRNESNLGPTGNFNHAVELARGEYFCIIGDDETVLPGNFAKKLAILDAHPEIGLVYSRHYYSNEQGTATELAMWPGMLHFSYVGGRDEFHDLFPWNYISLHSVVYRKELFERYGGFDPQITECGNDWEMNLRYAFHTQTAYVDEPLLNVRVHQGATTRRLGLLDQKLATGRIQVWRKWLVDKDEPLVLDERAWAHMHDLYARDVNFWFQGQPALIQKWLAEFQKMKADAEAAVQKHFYGAAPELAPSSGVILSGAKNLPRSPEQVARGQDSSPPAAPQNDMRGKAPIPVIWEGGFFETHSLALVNREWAAAVLRSGQVDLSLQIRQLEPLKFDPRTDPKLAPLVARVGKELPSPATVHIRHAWPPVFDRPAAGKWVMVQPWEYGRLPQEWVAPMRDLADEIWAYSTIVKQMYVESGVPGDKIHIVPPGIDSLRFRPDAPPMSLPSQKSVRFLFVGGTIWRKGIDVLLEAYRRTFTRADDVCLVIKDMGQDSFYKGQGAGETISRMQADPQAPEIVYATGSLSDDQMPGLYTACHCLVHPYRGEGFGLPVAEAMACGLATIVTQGGSTDDFCDANRAYLVPSTRRYVTIETPTAGQAWVLEPDIEVLGSQMRAVYQDRRSAAAMGRRASDWIRTNLTWEQGGAKALERIKALASESSDSAKRRGPSAREAELTAAIQRLTASSSIAPSMPIAHPSPANQAVKALDQAKAAIDRRDFAAAEPPLLQAIELDDNLAEAWHLLGVTRLNLGKLQESIVAHERAVSLRPDVSEFQNGLASAIAVVDIRHERALAALSKAVQLDPSNLSAWRNWAKAGTALGDWAAAAQGLERIEALAPDDVQLPSLKLELKNARAVVDAELPPPVILPDPSDLRYQPVISVLVPVHNVPVHYFQELVASIVGQTYPDWELCIVDDASTDDELKGVLRQLPDQDGRIKVKFLTESKRISGATNEALGMASGEYVAFLDHDDRLEFDALHHVAAAANEDPERDVIYSDEDKLTTEGQYIDSHLKPDWSPELLLSNMYMPHLLVVRRSLVQQVGGLRTDFDGAQDYDLALRVTELARKIHHIPVVLYHWRRIPGSTAVTVEEKPYAIEAGRRAVAEAMRRRGIDAEVEHGYYPCSYRPRLKLPAKKRVSIVIPTRDRATHLQRCIGSVQAFSEGVELQLIVVDNGSTDPAAVECLRQIERLPNARVLHYDEPFNYAAMNNLGARHASHNVLLFMHDDVQAAHQGWLDALMEFALFPGVGVAGPWLFYPGADTRTEHAGIVLGLGGIVGNVHRGMPVAYQYPIGPKRIGNYSAVSGACAMLRREVFQQVNGFDEDFAREFADVDLCLRLGSAGLRSVFTPFARLLHYTEWPWQRRASQSAEDSPEAGLLAQRWAGSIEHDPYFNRELPHTCEDFARWQHIHYHNRAVRVLEERKRAVLQPAT